MPNYWADSTPNCRKSARFSEDKMFFRHDNHGTGSHLHCCHGQIGRIRLQTAASSTVFCRFGPVRLLFVSKLEKSLAGQKFESNEEDIAATEAYFADLQTS